MFVWLQFRRRKCSHSFYSRKDENCKTPIRSPFVNLVKPKPLNIHFYWCIMIRTDLWCSYWSCDTRTSCTESLRVQILLYRKHCMFIAKDNRLILSRKRTIVLYRIKCNTRWRPERRVETCSNERLGIRGDLSDFALLLIDSKKRHAITYNLTLRGFRATIVSVEK